MLIVSAKLNPKRAALYMLLLGAALVALILAVGSAKRAGLPGRQDCSAATDQDCAAYLEALGWEVSPTPVETLTFTLPDPLNASYQDYNDLQLRQGFDLTPYAGRQVRRCSFSVLNYPDYPQQVQADLYLCGGQIIAGDILYYGVNGFVDTLIFP